MQNTIYGFDDPPSYKLLFDQKTIQASSQNRRGDQTIIVINEPPSIENNEENQNENRPVSNIRKQLLLAFLGFWFFAGIIMRLTNEFYY